MQCLEIIAHDCLREPISSFTDLSVVKEYHQRAGVSSDLDDQVVDGGDQDLTIVPNVAHEQLARSSYSMDVDVRGMIEAGGGDNVDDDEFEVESITGHQVSDPRSHPPELGRMPVMLYRYVV